jgi:hypothetical protein
MEQFRTETNLRGLTKTTEIAAGPLFQPNQPKPCPADPSRQQKLLPETEHRSGFKRQWGWIDQASERGLDTREDSKNPR